MLSQSVIWIDRGSMLYEMAYDPALIRAMEIYQDAYNKSGNNPTKINQSALKQRFSEELNGEWDLYLIDKKGIIIYTTFPADLKLDFSRYPSLFTTYSKYRQSGELVIDRTVKGFAPGAPHRKFAYQGTPDRQYLLEISRNFNHFFPSENRASYHELINTTIQTNPYITSIELFNSQHTKIASTLLNYRNVSPGSDVVKNVSKTFTSGVSTVIPGPEKNQLTEYRFLPVEDTGSPSTPLMHLVARIIYSIDPLQTRTLELMILVSCFLMITLSVGIIVAIAVSRHISRPLNRIGDDVDMIANGNLDHQITPTGVNETERIEKSINQMVAHLKEHIAKLQQREGELKEELENRHMAEDRYRRLFDSSHEAIFILEQGYIRDCNQEACTLFHATSDDLIGKKLIDFVPSNLRNQDNILQLVESDGSAGADSKMHQDPAIGEGISDECIFTCNNGSVIEAEVYVNRVNLDHSVIMQVMVRDKTIMNEMIRRELMAISKIEENLVQLATINDQIRNPLSIISTLCESQGGEYVEEIHNQITRIDILINEIDKGFISTDKVRMYLKKHYEVAGIHFEDEGENGK